MQSLTDQFKAFVKSKPADEAYDSADYSTCALGQFGCRDMTFYNCEDKGIPQEVYVAAAYPPEDDAEWFAAASYFTFGALADRLEKLTAEEA